MADETRTVLIDIEINEGDANKSITTLDNSINDLTKSKDESAESTKNLSKESKGLTDNTKKSKTATDSMTKSVTEYAKKLGPAVLAVGALVAIGKGLIESLKTNKALMDALSIETAALSGVMEQIATDVGNATIEFLGLEQAVSETGRKVTVTEGFLVRLGTSFAASNPKLAAYILNLAGVAQAASVVDQFQIALTDGITEYDLKVGRLNLKFEEQIALTRELDQTTTQQIATLGEATKTFEEISEITKDRLELEVALAKQILLATAGTANQKKAEDELNIVLLKQETTLKNLSARRRELLNRQKEATNRLIAEEKAHQLFIGTLEKENDEIDKLIEKTGLLADVTAESEEKQTAALEKSLEKSLAASDKRIAKSQEESDQIAANKKAETEAFLGGAESILSITDSLKGLNIENAALNKAIAVSQTIINTAAAIVKTLAQGGAFAIPAAIAVGAIGAAQLAIIQGQEFGSGGMLKGQPHSKGGININAEGGEAVINKTSMANPILRQIASDINVAGGGKRFQFGGIVGNTVPNATPSLSGISSDFERALSKSRTVLVLEDLNVTQDRVAVTEDRASLSPS